MYLPRNILSTGTAITKFEEIVLPRDEKTAELAIV
jgi:hypothetical protein